MPELGVYLVKPASIAACAAALMCSGVSKSGSPAPKPQTSMPSAFIALAFESMLRVSEGRENRGALGKFHGRLGSLGFGIWKSGCGAYFFANQLSISGFRLFSAILTMPISRCGVLGRIARRARH